MQTFPAGEERDSMVSNFARQVVETDPEGALEWAATLTDEKQRERQIQQLASQWKSFDKARATNWIQSSTALSPQAKEQLLK